MSKNSHSHSKPPPLTNGRTGIVVVEDDDDECSLTHIELPDETGHVVVLEELGKDLLGKALLVQH